jgi:transcriptional regulator of arginine metabolism
VKLERQSAIRDLLSGNGSDRTPNGGRESIANQDDLRRRLAARGIHVTQATLSRDIRELGLVKGADGYLLPEDAEDDGLPAIADTIRHFGLELRPVGNLLVVLTLNGAAAPIAAGIDNEEWPEVTGTIAGDNTVLVICPNAAAANTLTARMETYLG